MTFDPRLDIPHTESPYWPPSPTPAAAELSAVAGEGPARRALAVVRDVLVIVTCLAVLYGLVELYLFVGRLQVALQQFGENLSAVGF